LQAIRFRNIPGQAGVSFCQWRQAKHAIASQELNQTDEQQGGPDTHRLFDHLGYASTCILRKDITNHRHYRRLIHEVNSFFSLIDPLTITDDFSGLDYLSQMTGSNKNEAV
jgi:hypothetical protein